MPSQKGHILYPRKSDIRRRYTAEEYGPGGIPRNWYIGHAFYTKHKPNLQRLRAGNVPQRATDEWGKQIEAGGMYGLLWLPKVVEVVGYDVTVEPDVPGDLAALASNIYG